MIKPQKFIITGGFRDENSAEGFIGLLTLSSDGMQTSLDFKPIIVTEPPDKALCIPNKGFAGGTIYNQQLWVCSANQLLAYSVDNWQLTHVIDNPLFNDLHHVLADESGLHIVNTGLEAIDYLTFDGELIGRTLLTSDDRTNFRIKQTDDFRLYHSEPHFMHANHCAKNQHGDLLITLARQRRIINMQDWSWASPEYETSPHDGMMAIYTPHQQNYLWASNVHGKIIAYDDRYKTTKIWNLYDYDIPPGWARGLAILQDGFLVGTSKLTTSNRGYYMGWSIEDCKKSQTTIAYIPFSEHDKSSVVTIFPERKAAKIFSIIADKDG